MTISSSEFPDTSVRSLNQLYRRDQMKAIGSGMNDATIRIKFYEGKQWTADEIQRIKSQLYRKQMTAIGLGMIPMGIFSAELVIPNDAPTQAEIDEGKQRTADAFGTTGTLKAAIHTDAPGMPTVGETKADRIWKALLSVC